MANDQKAQPTLITASCNWSKNLKAHSNHCILATVVVVLLINSKNRKTEGENEQGDYPIRGSEKSETTGVGDCGNKMGTRDIGTQRRLNYAILKSQYASPAHVLVPLPLWEDDRRPSAMAMVGSKQKSELWSTEENSGAVGQEDHDMCIYTKYMNYEAGRSRNQRKQTRLCSCQYTEDLRITQFKIKINKKVKDGDNDSARCSSPLFFFIFFFF